jgi:hypothetical protein
VERAVETNLMEREEHEMTLKDGRMAFDMGPFQIRTFKLS